MKRLHIHLNVKNLQQSVQFYSQLFESEPTVLKADYAKWQLDDPFVNFAISNHSQQFGVDHLGLQVTNNEGLEKIKTAMELANQPIAAQQDTHCCYARSNKYWTTDPDGIAWEAFHSMETIATYHGQSNNDEPKNASKKQSSCCVSTTSGCC
ncbi:ArsI/CadI family heavy metal resistance metalloenzyme [Spartinivicinus poritis]|uniref:Glyoxalase/bleomycin resistance/dioxygenase family protein n=1 Tax=Spartinivicinus poritis TaxID=2994640 RepID=A0ABT5U8H7_9GAMM|nr:ArsI/CadI family heavy metal resistance metalloenzyme [Spartinivicinus sp. A2-2]MDE1462655.1 glyoxalase/bleomycin resistance/dioxygenase family protein [Spartinivicinus sp. A2-2]